MHIDQESKTAMTHRLWAEGKLTDDATGKGISFRS